MKKLKVMSFCSGAEGLGKPFHNDPFFEIVGFSEVDPHASAVLSYHYPEIKNWGDLTKINAEELPDFDVTHFGFPCQSWSQAGRRAGFDDLRGQIIFHIGKIIEHKKPKYFLAENVKGLLSHQGGKSFEVILEYLSSLGYALDFEILNAKHFGVPQNRERIFIFGKRKEIPNESGQTEESINEESENFLSGDDSPSSRWTEYCEIKRNLGRPRGSEILSLAGESGQIVSSTPAEREQNRRDSEHPVLEVYSLTERRTESAKEERRKNQKLGKDYCSRRDKELVPRSDGLANCVTATHGVEQLLLEVKREAVVIDHDRLRGIGERANCLDANYWKGHDNHGARTLIAHSSSGRDWGREERIKVGEANTLTCGVGCSAQSSATYVVDGGREIARTIRSSGQGSGFGDKHNWDTYKLERDGKVQIRRLTPLECERLMAWEDNFTKYGKYGSDVKEISDAKRYKICGNGVVSNCSYPFKELIKELEVLDQLVPQGPYCYESLEFYTKEGEDIPRHRVRLCPFWERKEDYIAYCKLTDILDDACINDQCKVCRVNL